MTTESIPRTVDPSGEPDPLFGRYRLALGRSWKWILGASLVIGLVAALLLGKSSATAVARVGIDQTVVGLLEPVDLDENLADVPELSELRDLAASYDEPDGVTVLTDLSSSGLTVSVVAETADEAQTIATSLVEQMNARTVERRQAFVASLRATISSDQQLLESRLEEIDEGIAGLPADTAVSDAVLNNRQSVADDLNLASRRLAALDLYDENDRTTIVAFDQVRTSNGRMLWFVAGTLLAAAIGSAWVIVRAHGDRRVWSRRDVAALRLAPVLPLLPTSGDEVEVAAASIRRAAGDRDALLIPVGAADAVVRQLAEVLPDAVATEPGRLHVSMDDGGHRAILVGAIGATRLDDLVRTAEYVESLGGEVTSVVIGGVSERELRRADG